MGDDEKSGSIVEVDEHGKRRGVKVTLTDAGIERTSVGWRTMLFWDALRGVRLQSRMLAPDKVYLDTTTGTIEWTMRRGKGSEMVQAIERRRAG